MALIVKSGINALRIIHMPQPKAATVAHALALDGRSFYYEPMPDDRAVIYVDVEHEARVLELKTAGESSWGSVRGGKWHKTVSAEPTFTRDEESLCGITFRPLNVTHGEPPRAAPRFICTKCAGQPHRTVMEYPPQKRMRELGEA